MNLKSILAVVVAVLAGTIGGAAAYSVATPGNASGPASTSTTLQPAAETQDVSAGQVEKIVKLRPCRKPAERVGKKCVTDVTHTVVLPGQARSGSTAPAPAPGTPTVGDDDSDGDEQGADQGDDQGGSTPGTGSDDQGDDDQYDDHGDDDSDDDEADDQSDDQDEPGDDDSDETESPEVED
jgi:hypothetical protein